MLVLKNVLLFWKSLKSVTIERNGDMNWHIFIIVSVLAPNAWKNATN